MSIVDVVSGRKDIEQVRAYRAGWMKGACGYDTDVNDQRNRVLKAAWLRGHADGLAARMKMWDSSWGMYCEEKKT